MRIRWARSATKHRINHDRSGHVVKTATTIIRQPAPSRSQLKDDRLVFLGPDQSGVLLEVMAVEITDGVLVIHAMKMRSQYQQHLKGAATDDDEID